MNSESLILSIIIPIYNVEKYLEDCLASVETLPSDKCEVILVDDGSIDNSKMIAKQFVGKNPYLFKYFYKENGGLSSARNFGISKSSGEYITFIDSDDWVNSDLYLSIIDQTDNSIIDVFIADYVEVYKSGEKIVKDINIGNKIVYEAMVCNKIFRKALFVENNIEFPYGLHYEDNQTCYQLLALSNEIKKIDKVLYYYRQERDGQITSKMDRGIYDINIIADNLSIYFDGFSMINPKIKEDFELLYIRNIMFRTIPKIIRVEKPNYFKIKKKIRNQYLLLEKYFPKWYENSNLIEDKSSYFLKKIGKNHVKKLKCIKNSLLCLIVSVLTR